MAMHLKLRTILVLALCATTMRTRALRASSRGTQARARLCHFGPLFLREILLRAADALQQNELLLWWRVHKESPLSGPPRRNLAKALELSSLSDKKSKPFISCPLRSER